MWVRRLAAGVAFEQMLVVLEQEKGVGRDWDSDLAECLKVGLQSTDESL